MPAGQSAIMTQIKPSSLRQTSAQLRVAANASAPFDRDDGDVLLLSADGVKFSCHKSVLAIASPWFQKIVSLDRKDGKQTVAFVIGDQLVIRVTESSKVIDTFLRLLYPVVEPALSSNSALVVEVLQATRKYEVLESPGISALSRAFDAFAVGDPLKTFAMCCRFGMEDKAAHVAQKLLCTIHAHLQKKIIAHPDAVPVAAWSDDVTAGTFFRLQWFLKKNGAVKSSFRFLHHTPFDGTTTAALSDVVGAVSSTVSPSASTTSWVASSGLLSRLPADIHVRSVVDSTFDVPAHKSILALSSPILAEKIKQSSDKASDGLLILSLCENGPSINRLLQCCYGATSSLLVCSNNLSVESSVLIDVVRVAGKYAMDVVVDAARVVLQPYLYGDPIQAYYVAIACGWEQEARDAARHCADLTRVASVYVSEMENCPASAFLRLHKYLAACHRKRQDIFERLLSDTKPQGAAALAAEFNVIYTCGLRPQSIASVLLRRSPSVPHSKDNFVSRRPSGDTVLSAASALRALLKAERIQKDSSSTQSGSLASSVV